MSNFFNLLKVQAITFLTGNDNKKKKKAKRSFGVAFVALLLVAVFVVCGYFYSKIFAEGFKAENKLIDLLPTMIALSAIVCFAFSYYSVSNLIFKVKDYDLLASLPIKSHTIVISKLTFSMVLDIIICLAITIPSLFVYKSFGGELTNTYIIYTLILALFAPFIMICISIFFSLIISLISTRFKNKGIVQTIISFILTIALLVGVFSISAKNSTKIQDIVSRVYFLYPWLVKGQTDLLYLLIFVGVSLLSFIVITAFVCSIYKWINSKLKATTGKKNFRLKNYVSRSPMKTILRKEIKTLFSIPTYAVNCLLGQILAIVFSVVFFILTRTTSIQSKVDLAPYVPLVLTFTFLLAPITAPSISLEGQAFWILKTSPIKYKTIFNAKLLNHILFSTIPAVIVGVLFAFACSSTVVSGILLVITSILISLFAGISGLLLNIAMPNLNWTTEAKPVKQSMPVFIHVIMSIVITGVIATILILAGKYNINIDPVVFLGCLSGFFLLLSIIEYSLIMNNGEKWLNKKL